MLTTTPSTKSMTWLLLVLSTSSLQLVVIFLNAAVTIDQTATASLCCLSINTGCTKMGNVLRLMQSPHSHGLQSEWDLFVPFVYTVLSKVKLSHTHSIMQSIKGHDKFYHLFYVSDDVTLTATKFLWHYSFTQWVRLNMLIFLIIKGAEETEDEDCWLKNGGSMYFQTERQLWFRSSARKTTHTCMHVLSYIDTGIKW